MRKEDKNLIIDQLVTLLDDYAHFYVANIENLNAEQTSQLRRQCHKEGIKLVVVKNTLFRRALEKKDDSFNELYPSLKGSSSIMFSNVGNSPAKLIKEFRKSLGKKALTPEFKAAYVEQSFYIGAENLDVLVSIKSKEELVGDIIGLLQSPAINVVSALKSSGATLSNLLKTLSDRD